MLAATAFRPGPIGEASMTYLVVRAIVIMVALAVTGMQMPAHARSTRVVPTDYPTIQAAIDAAQAGGTITVLAGTYTEQLRIRKDLEINITYNTVVGPGPAGGVATDGIEFPVGSVGTIAHNTVSGNICPPTDPACGPDWFTQFQHAGILAGGWGPGTVVTNNLTFGNQVGMLLGESDEISHNRMVDNEFFGLGLFDGTFLIDGAQISGGGGGVWVIADSADTTVVLKNVTFSGLSGPVVEKVECCSFTATVIGGP
jgi:parallel beta helix pectate lyase-like protein